MSNKLIFSPLIFILFCVLISCNKKAESKVNNYSVEPLSEKTKSYWYSGLAEITSYELTQQRYGEERIGKAVLIFVTEDFEPEQLIKADQQTEKNYPVLKLNSTKDFNTGIYPYHIMQSSFLPMENNNFPVKITTSIQEWCGQSFMMLENKKNFKISINSYFQQVGNQQLDIDKIASENAIWNQLRLFPNQIDTSITTMLPSFEYLRLNNKEIKGYEVIISQEQTLDTLLTQLHYPELKRKIKLYQEIDFPNVILGWEESTNMKDSTLITKAKKLKTIQIDYWNKNSEIFTPLRDSLQL